MAAVIDIDWSLVLTDELSEVSSEESTTTEDEEPSPEEKINSFVNESFLMNYLKEKYNPNFTPDISENDFDDGLYQEQLFTQLLTSVESYPELEKVDIPYDTNFCTIVDQFKETGIMPESMRQFNHDVYYTTSLEETYNCSIQIFGVYVKSTDTILHFRIWQSIYLWCNKPLSEIGYCGIEFPTFFNTIRSMGYTGLWDHEYQEPLGCISELFCFLAYPGKTRILPDGKIDILSQDDVEHLLTFFSTQPETGRFTKAAIRK